MPQDGAARGLADAHTAPLEALGIATLIHQAPLALALLHQAMAMVVLTIAVAHAERLERRRARVGEAAGGTVLRHEEQAT